MQFTKYEIIVVCSCALRHFAYLHTDHTLCAVSVMKDNGWLMHAEHLHICCAPPGEFWGMPSPFERCWGVGNCSWDATWKLGNSQTQAFTSITSSLGRFLQPHQTVLRRGLLTGKGSRWAPLGFWFSETWYSCIHVFGHLWTQSLTQNKWDD